MSFINDLLSENGTISTMRLMSFLGLLAGIAVAAIGIYRGSDLSELAVLTGVFVAPAFGFKALQRKFENEGEQK